MAYIKTLTDTARVWRGLFEKSRNLRGRVIAMQLLGATQDMAYTLIVAQAFESVIDAVTSGSENTAELIAAYAVLSLLVVLVWGFGANYISNRTQDMVQVKFRSDMLKSALAAGKLDEGNLIKRYSADNKKAAQFLVRAIASQAFSPVLGGMVSLVMIYLIHPMLAFTAMAVGAVLFALEARHVHKAQHYASQQSDAKGEFSSDMYQITQNLPVLRMFASVPLMKERAYAHSAAVYGGRREGRAAEHCADRLSSACLVCMGTLAMVLVSCLLARQGAQCLSASCSPPWPTARRSPYLFDGLAHRDLAARRAAGRRASGCWPRSTRSREHADRRGVIDPDHRAECGWGSWA